MYLLPFQVIQVFSVAIKINISLYFQSSSHQQDKPLEGLLVYYSLLSLAGKLKGVSFPR